MSNGNLTRHHIVPVSRMNGKKLGDENIVLLTSAEHEAYHTLFGNRTPDEIIAFLVHRCWNHESNWVWVALRQLQD